MVLAAGICPLPEALLQVAPSQSRLGCRVVEGCKDSMGVPEQRIQGLWDGPSACGGPDG